MSVKTNAECALAKNQSNFSIGILAVLNHGLEPQDSRRGALVPFRLELKTFQARKPFSTY